MSTCITVPILEWSHTSQFITPILRLLLSNIICNMIWVLFRTRTMFQNTIPFVGPPQTRSTSCTLRGMLSTKAEMKVWGIASHFPIHEFACVHCPTATNCRHNLSILSLCGFSGSILIIVIYSAKISVPGNRELHCRPRSACNISYVSDASSIVIYYNLKFKFCWCVYQC